MLMQAKHRERFAVRARYMTLKPSENKYVKYFSNIRIIQKDLTDRADMVSIPMIDNTYGYFNAMVELLC